MDVSASQRMLLPEQYREVSPLVERLGLKSAPRNFWIALGLVEVASLGAFAAAALGALQVPAHSWEEPSGTCENAPRGNVQQPSTAMSAWAYVCVGIIVWACGAVDFHTYMRRSASKTVSDRLVITAMSAELDGQAEHFVGVEADHLAELKPCLLQRHMLWSLVFGCALIFQGCWGFWYHAWNSIDNYRTDLFAWVCDSACLCAYLGARALAFGFANHVNPCKGLIGCSIHCSTRARQNFALAATVLALVFLGIFLIAFANAGGLQGLTTPSFALATFSTLGLLQFVFLVWHHYGKHLFIDTRWTLASWGVALLLSGFCFDYYDAYMCAPASYLQAHAAFHALTAAGLLCCYMALRSDAFIYEYVYAIEKRPTQTRKEAYRIPLSTPNNSKGEDPEAGFVVDLASEPAALFDATTTPAPQRLSTHSATAQPRLSGTPSRPPRLSAGSALSPGSRDSSATAVAAAARRDSHMQPRSAPNSVRRDSPLVVASPPGSAHSSGRRDSPTVDAVRPRQRSLERNIFEVSTAHAENEAKAAAPRRDSQPIELVRPRPNSLERTIFQQQAAGVDPTLSERERRLSQTKARKLEPRPVDLEKDVFYLSGGGGTDGRGSVASDSSHRSRFSQHSHHTHHSGSSRHSAGHYWTCASCAYAENELLWVHCDRCNWARPPLSTFTVAP